MKRTLLTTGIAALLMAPACGGDGGDDVLEGVNSVVILQRTLSSGDGDIFRSNTAFRPGARLITLTPPTADGEVEVICCDHLGPEFENMDINGYDISFDASEIVFSGQLQGDGVYGLFKLDLETGDVVQLPTDPTQHYIYPHYLSGGKIGFNTTAVVEEGAPQFRDEYERGTVTQMGTMNDDGSSPVLQSRNLSHSFLGTQLWNGKVMYTMWNHVAEMNAGHLLIQNPDGSGQQEGFGKEGTGVTNSYYKAFEVEPGRVVAIGSSRDRTLQSGTILDIRLGLEDDEGGYTQAMSEANASYKILTPGVPLGREPSSDTIGRYFSAYPLNDRENVDLLVSWADGPVQSEILGAADVPANFGVYLLDTANNQRKPLYDHPDYWDIFPRPLTPRTAPPVISDRTGDPLAGDGVLFGTMNIYDSSIANFEPGSVYGVRVVEGFSSEEGIPNDFGLTEHEGAALLGTARVQPDGSYAAVVPPNVPVRQQAVDKYGMALAQENIWVKGNAGESRFCGGCHEDRAATTVIQPGITEALAVGAADLMSDVPRYDGSGALQRVSSQNALDLVAGSFSEVVGVPWGGAAGGGDIAIQAIFDRPRPGAPDGQSCSGCHNGVAGAANPSYTITDPTTGESQTIVFDLSGSEVSIEIGGEVISGYSASHMSLLGPDMMELEEAGLEIVGDMKIYVETGNARESELIRYLNPPAFYDTSDFGSTAVFAPNMDDRAFGPATGDFHQNILSAEEYYMLVLMADMGGQFYSRENAPGGNGYQQ